MKTFIAGCALGLFFIAVGTVGIEAGKTVAAKTVKIHKHLGKHESSKIVARYISSRLGYRINLKKTPWCAAFVNAVLKDRGLKGTKSLAARSFLKWGKAVKAPKKGDIMVFKRGKSKWQGHVAFYVSKGTKNGKAGYMVLGGNQDNKVKVKWYSKSRLISIRRQK